MSGVVASVLSPLASVHNRSDIPGQQLLNAALERGIITRAQHDEILKLGNENDSERQEAPSTFNWVNAAYAVGALLVIFAFAWFLVARWAQLGPPGVLIVGLIYAGGFLAGERFLLRWGYPRAAALMLALFVSITPLVVWALLAWTGEWPPDVPKSPLLSSATYMASRSLILELSTILVGLFAIRSRPSPLLTLPIALATALTCLHCAQLFEPGWGVRGFEHWVLMGLSLAVLAIAEGVERWQRREARAGRYVGDHAASFWLVGMLGFSVSFAAWWLPLREYRHVLGGVAVGITAVSLYVGRKMLFAFGILYVVGYLAYLANDVFKTGAAFPLALAAIGVLTIAAAVWVQRRFPKLLDRGASEMREIPWSAPMAWLPAVFAIGLSLTFLADRAEVRQQQEFHDRFVILQGHSGSLRARGGPPKQKMAPQPVEK